MFKIVAADTSNLRIATLLTQLQVVILSGDTPANTDAGWWWLAFAGDQPAGFCGMYASAQWGDTGYLCRAGVLDAFTGHGLQRRFIRVRERQARKLGWKWLLSDTFENPRSMNNLIRCGYRTFTPSQPWGGDGVVYWKKRLA